MLDFRSVSSRVGKVAVLFNGDLRRRSVSHRLPLGLCPNWMPLTLSQMDAPNMPGLGNIHPTNYF